MSDGTPRDNARPKSLLLECEGGGAALQPPPPAAPPPLPPRGAKHPTSDTLRILETIENASNVITRGNTVPRDFLFYPSAVADLPPGGWRHTAEPSGIIAQRACGVSWWLRMLPWYGGGARSQVLTTFTRCFLPPASWLLVQSVCLAAARPHGCLLTRSAWLWLSIRTGCVAASCSSPVDPGVGRYPLPSAAPPLGRPSPIPCSVLSFKRLMIPLTHNDSWIHLH